MKTIEIQPDAVAVIANRLAARLRAEGIFPANPNRADQRELHLDIIDRMLGARP